MLIKDLKNCRPFTAGDGSILSELLNPGKEKLNIRYSLAHATVRPGQATLAHRLKSAEVYYILGGTGEMTFGNDRAQVSAGQAVYVPPCSVQSIRNTGEEDLVFLCIVDPAWKPEDEEVIEKDVPG
jgi:mannose-6-phosphate isomerase-like protein (cupin superfamily)